MEAEAQFLQAKFLQGVYPFEGRGLECPLRLTDELFYDVPLDKHAQLLYFRAGNSTDEMIYGSLQAHGMLTMQELPFG